MITKTVRSTQTVPPSFRTTNRSSIGSRRKGTRPTTSASRSGVACRSEFRSTFTTRRFQELRSDRAEAEHPRARAAEKRVIARSKPKYNRQG